MTMRRWWGDGYFDEQQDNGTLTTFLADIVQTIIIIVIISIMWVVE